jgi:hypothetical protein
LEAEVSDKKSKRARRHTLRRVDRLNVGRDDMNLAEFPLASLDDRLPKDQKTLVFEDQIRVKGEHVTRRLTISASDKYGLPTALDDEVIVGLIQLTRHKGFAEKRVEFTRYELIRLLGWRDEGKSYQRIDESLKRWLGVSLYYDKAWWDKKEKSWVSESFHILDNVTLYDRERYARRKKAGGLAAGCSSFSWNEIVFQSFRVGYLRKLDLQVYRGFRSAVAKRLYRFTGKRFYKKARWEFDLQTLCFDKLGMARTDHTGLLKRRLSAGIRELEERGIVKHMPMEERYQKTCTGKWVVMLEKGTCHQQAVTGCAASFVRQLVERGLSRQSAEYLVRERAHELIAERIRLHDWLVERRDVRASRRPAGFLAQSIRHEYPLPEDFLADVARPRGMREDRTPETGKAIRAVETIAAPVAPDHEELLAFFSEQSKTEQERLETAALAAAGRVHADSYARLKGTQGPLFDEIRREVLVSYLRGHYSSLAGATSLKGVSSS